MSGSVPIGRNSELEGVVLGLIGSREPCTAYAVRSALQESPSTHWSASAGAIYPLIRRLVSQELVEAVPDPDDGRGRTLLSLTSTGRSALRRWVLEASDPDVASSVFDAVRVRAFFLDALSPEERARFAEEGVRSLEAFLERARAYEDIEGITPLERVVAAGAVQAAQARLAWMQQVREVTRHNASDPDADRAPGSDPSPT